MTLAGRFWLPEPTPASCTLAAHHGYAPPEETLGLLASGVGGDRHPDLCTSPPDAIAGSRTQDLTVKGSRPQPLGQTEASHLDFEASRASRERKSNPGTSCTLTPMRAAVILLRGVSTSAAPATWPPMPPRSAVGNPKHSHNQMLIRGALGPSPGPAATRSR